MLHDGVTAIHDEAFRGCSKLKTLTLLPSVATVEGNPFGGCTALELTVYAETPGAACAEQNCLPHKMVKNNLIFPAAMTEVLAETFLSDTSLTYVRIPDRMTAIGAGAWKGCANLAYVYIPGTVTTIADDAFADCPKLTICCPAGSAAHAYAQAAGVPCATW